MLYVLQNEELMVMVRSRGAELRSLKERSDETEYFWHGDPVWWKYSSPILFPIVGKLKGGEYQVAGHSYALPAHGLGRISEFRCVEHREATIAFELTWNEESLKSYPWRFRLGIGYELTGRAVKVKWQVSNADTAAMYFSIGAHPAFRCPIVYGEKLTDCYLEFSEVEQAANFRLTGDTLLERETEPSIAGKKIPLNDEFFRRGVRVYENLKSDAISIKSRKSSKSLTIAAPDFPYWGIWAPEAGGAPFICLEPWYGHMDFVDGGGEFSRKEGNLKLDPGEEFHAEYTISV